MQASAGQSDFVTELCVHQPFEIRPVSKFVRRLGSKEALIEMDGTRFRGCRTERVYAREPYWAPGKEQ